MTYSYGKIIIAKEIYISFAIAHMQYGVCGEMFEKNYFKTLYNNLEESELLTASKSGFWCNDLCVCASQLWTVFHEIYTAFDASPTLETEYVRTCWGPLTKFHMKL